MRKLTVKNFSVIKDAELEFGKITVLIGPQASGKSLLCKLAFFFECRVPEILLDCLMNHYTLKMAGNVVVENFRSDFPEEGREGQEFEIVYEVGSFYFVYIAMSAEYNSYILNWINGFEVFYEECLTNTTPKLPSFESDRRRLVMSGGDPGLFPLKSDSVYIPTGRAFYSTPNRGFAVLSARNLDWITSRYATEFDANYRDLRESYQTNRVLLDKVGLSSIEMMGGKVVQEAGRLLFESIEDRRKRPHEILSSGTLELLPIFNTLAQVAKKTGDPINSNMPAPPVGMVYIEEPELSVFPKTQYEFAKLIALLANSNLVWKSYAITTHSPYILSAFGNLIKAGMAGAQSTEHHAAVAKVIPEQYWIKEGDFAAYKIENGVLVSIFDKKTGQIDGDYLDDVSSDIAEEFGQLLEIQYGR